MSEVGTGKHNTDRKFVSYTTCRIIPRPLKNHEYAVRFRKTRNDSKSSVQNSFRAIASKCTTNASSNSYLRWPVMRILKFLIRFLATKAVDRKMSQGLRPLEFGNLINFGRIFAVVNGYVDVSVSTFLSLII
jgi:hypothetical protein